MGAPQKVTPPAIRRALTKWRGVVSDAARELGINRDSLYDAIARLGLDLESYRMNGKPGMAVKRYRGMSGMGTMGTIQARRVGVAELDSVRDLHAETVGRSITRMEAAKDAIAEEQIPIRGVPERRPKITIPPGIVDRLRDAKLDFTARWRLETDEQTILEQFLEEELEPWIARKLAGPVAVPDPDPEPEPEAVVAKAPRRKGRR